VKHKQRRTTIVRNNFDTTFSLGKFLVFYGAELGVFFYPVKCALKVLQNCNQFVSGVSRIDGNRVALLKASGSCLSQC
jgi:hypothetical protein